MDDISKREQRFTMQLINRNWCREFYDWYNFKHHYSGLNGHTPEQVFTGSYAEVFVIKQAALDERYSITPERFVKGCPNVKLSLA